MKKPLDLGIKPPAHPGPTVPSFRKQYRTINSAILAAAGSPVIFTPNAAVTVQWVLATFSAACTVQILLNGQPFGALLPIGAGDIVRFAGTLLVNNETLSISVSAPCTINYEVVWIKEFFIELIEKQTTVVNPGTNSSSVVSENLIQWGSVAVAPATTTAPVGTESAPVVRAISRKNTIVETTTPLAANATFTGAWHDSQADGTTWVDASSIAGTASANSTLNIDISDDITNAGMTISSYASKGTSLTSLLRIWCPIRARYWRVRYVNGPTLLASLEITSCASSIQPITPTNEIISGNPLPLAVSVVNPQGATAIADNINGAALANGAGLNNVFPMFIAPFIYGGAFSGTSNVALSNWSKQRAPTVFKRATTAAVAAAAVWTPGTGNKFRLLKYRIIVGASATLAAAGDVTITLLDAALDLGLAIIVRIPAAALGSGVNFDSQVCDLGKFGILSAAANNALNVTLSSALAAGLVQVFAWGTEE